MLGAELSYPFNSFIIVNDIIERNAIPAQNRSEGMHVLVLENNFLYVLDQDLISWHLSDIQGQLDGYAPLSSPSVLPIGGLSDELLVKQSEEDFDTGWVTADDLRVGNGIPSDGYTYPVFGWDTFSSGLSRSPSEITLDGYTAYPFVEYFGADAGPHGWTARAGPSLTLDSSKGGTNHPIYNKLSVFTDDTRVVQLSTDGYVFSASSGGELTTEDFVIETCFRIHNLLESSSHTIVSKHGSVTSRWRLEITNLGRIVLYLQTSSGSSTCVLGANGTISEGAWYHMIIYADRSGSVVNYLNGTQGTAISISARNGETLDDAASDFFIGAYESLATGNAFSGDIAFVRMWKHSSWLSTHLQDSSARERCAMVVGLWSQYGDGIRAPISGGMSRTSNAYRHLYRDGYYSAYRVGNNWIGIDSGPSYTGLVREHSVQNRVLYSVNIEESVWTKLDCTISVSSVMGPCPDENAPLRTIDGYATTAEHGVTQTTSSITGSGTLFATVSVFAKPGNQDWCYLEVPEITGTSCYFNVSTGVVGTLGSNIQSIGRITPWIDGTYRVSLSFIASLTTTYTMRILAASGDGQKTYLGASGDLHIGWAQFETGSFFATSLIRTDGALITRNADVLQHSAILNVPNNSPHTVVSRFDFPGVWSSGNSNNLSQVFAITDSSGTENAITLSIQSNRQWLCSGSSSNVSQWQFSPASPVVSAPGEYLSRIAVKPNNVQFYVNDALIDTDLSASLPLNYSIIRVASSRVNNLQLGVPLISFRIYNGEKPLGDVLYKSSASDFDAHWGGLPEPELTAGDLAEYLDGYFSSDGYSNVSLSNAQSISINVDLLPQNSLQKNLGRDDLYFRSVYANYFNGTLDDGEILHPNQPMFGWSTFESGASKISPTIEINGNKVEATLFYVGNDADGYEWKAVRGPSLFLADTGSAPVSGYRAPFTDGTTAVRFPTTSDQVYQATDSTVGDIGTDDYVMLIVSNYRGGTTYVSKKAQLSLTTGGTGWAFGRQGGFNSFRHVDATGGVGLLTLATSSYVWNVNMICVDRDASTSASSARTYSGGVYAGDVAGFQTYQGNISSPYPLTIGASGDLSENIQGSVALFALWKGPNLFSDGGTNPATMDALAKELAEKLIGISPEIADGYALQQSNVRNGDASLMITQDGITSLFHVGSGWARIQDYNGVKGFLSESQSTNLFHFSTVLTNAVWVRSGVSVSTNVDSGPGDGSFYNMNSSNSVANFMYQDVAIADLTYTYSFFCQAANATWVYLSVPTLSNVDGYFNLSGDGSLGTIGASVLRSKIESFGNSNYRVQISFAGTAATHRFLLAPASDDLTIVTSTLTPALRLGWGQLEQKNRATSVIWTSSAASVSRASDNLFYHADLFNHPQTTARTIVADFHLGDVSLQATSNIFRNSTTGTSPQESVNLTTDGYLQSQGFGAGGSTQWNFTSSVAVPLSKINTVRYRADTNDIQTYLDSVSVGTDSVAVLPTVNRLGIGTGAASANTGQIDGVITKLFIYNGDYIPGAEGTGDDL